jgi:hypothetical protein
MVSEFINVSIGFEMEALLKPVLGLHEYVFPVIDGTPN